MILYHNNKCFAEQVFKLEVELEKELVAHSKLVFGDTSVYIDAKKKIEAKTLGGTIPDGFLFDLSDPDNAEFYLVEAELATHGFFDHIFPQITKFFAFFKNNSSQATLIEKIYSLVNGDGALRGEFAQHLGNRELYKFIKDTVEGSQNILLVIDDEKKEFPEIMDTYSDTWGKSVRLMTLKKFVCNGEMMLSCHPEFERIEIPDMGTAGADDPGEATSYSEEYHLEGVSEVVKTIYRTLKDEALRINPGIQFNPQKYYISIKDKKNVAYFEFRKKKVQLVVLLPEEQVRTLVKTHAVKLQSESVQRYWGGTTPNCKIILSSDEALGEIIEILKLLLATGE